MSGSGTSLRPLGGVVLLVLQLATASAWAVLEAQANPETGTAHIEQSGGTDCPPPHNETLCRLCQVEANRLPISGPAVPPVAQPVRSATGPASARRSTLVSILTAGAPRAPPAAA
jgi:hypothetical protein